MQAYFAILKKLFLHPGKFIKSVSKEKDHWKITKIFAIFYITLVVLDILFGVLIKVRAGLPQSPVLTTLTQLIVGSVFAFVIPYAGSAIIHLTVWLFGGRQGYFNTFKPVTYGFVLYLVYDLLSTVVTGILQLIQPIIPGIPYTQGYATFLIILSGVFLLVGLIFSLYTQVIGVKVYQKLSTVRAFFGVTLIPLILIGIYISLIIVAFSALSSL